MIPTHITKLQQNFMHLLFSFRYITSSQLQTYLNHSTKRQTNRHLKILREKGYIRDIIKEGEKGYSESTIYCLGPAGIRYLRILKDLTPEEIKNRYKDHTRSQTFVDHNLLVTTVFLQLRKQAEKDNSTLTFQTKQDYEEGSVFAMLHPDTFVIQEKDGNNRQFFFEIIDPITPRFVIRKRVRQYVKYFLNNSVE